VGQAASSPRIVRFGMFEVDLANRELRKRGIRLRLQEQPFQVLVALLEKPGAVVTREELVRLLWQDGTIVDFERGLNAAVTRLRQALSDSPETPKYIETVARRGYRFISSVEQSGAEVRVARGLHRFRLPGHRWIFASIAVATLLVVSGVFTRLPPHQNTLIALPLTTLPGAAGSPTLSPDGNQVAFAWNGPEGDNFDIYGMAIPGGTPLRLTYNPGVDHSPAWAPDGRWIAFLRSGDVFLVSPTGGNARQVGHVNSPVGTVCQCESGREMTRFLGWTPDSRYLIVTDAAEGPPASLWLLSIETGKSDRLTTPPKTVLGDSDPVMSSDGRWLAFRRAKSDATSEVYLQPLGAGFRASGEPERIQSFCGEVTLAWIPDASSIVFSSEMPSAKSGITCGLHTAFTSPTTTSAGFTRRYA
jgi:Tol biopolymer transport system component/DNA-binding winged helix-turn-helix (wHTH) protein